MQGGYPFSHFLSGLLRRGANLTHGGRTTRRANLAQIPAAIQELATKYAEGGGDRKELLKAVNEHEQ